LDFVFYLSILVEDMVSLSFIDEGGMGETMTSKDKPMNWCLSKDCTRVQSNVRGKNMSGIVIGGKTTRSFCFRSRKKN